MGLALKLKIMSVKMGMYRNRNTAPIQNRDVI
jgi:hypothetical protein